MCKYPKCDRKHHSHGLCIKHVKWLRKGLIDADMNQLKPFPRWYSGCKVEGCGAKHRRHGFCVAHDAMYKRGTMNLAGRRTRPRILYHKDAVCFVCGTGGKLAKGFCKLHYQQFNRKMIRIDGALRRQPKRGQYQPGAKCLVPRCEGRPRVRGYCRNCSVKIRSKTMDQLGNRLIHIAKNIGKNCIVDGCNKPAICKLMCRSHYGKATYTPTPKINKGKTCSALLCNKPASCRGKCTTHYSRWKAKLRKDLHQAQGEQEERLAHSRQQTNS